MSKTKKKKYKLKSKVFLWSGDMAAWHFIGVPKKEAIEIKSAHAGVRRGFGSIPVTVTIGKSEWQTSIFPDKKTETYVLPLKAKIRQAEGILEGDEVTFILDFSKPRLSRKK